MNLERREAIADEATACARIATELARLTDRWCEPDAVPDVATASAVLAALATHVAQVAELLAAQAAQAANTA